jgi:twitching motility protein PilU
MQRSNELGMKTFDQALFQLYEDDLITYDEALRNADSVNELRLRIKLEGKAAKAADKLAGLEGMGLVEEDNTRVMVR